jgi:hypothetical protein
MEAVKVGIREFRDNLATYLLESEMPVAITRHGDTVGHYFPVRRKRTEEDRAALRAASEQVKAMMDAAGISEDEINGEIDQALLEEKQARRAAR